MQRDAAGEFTICSIIHISRNCLVTQESHGNQDAMFSAVKPSQRLHHACRQACKCCAVAQN